MTEGKSQAIFKVGFTKISKGKEDGRLHLLFEDQIDHQLIGEAMKILP
jgi:hypothetical protein